MTNKLSLFVILAILGLTSFAPLSRIYIDEPIYNNEENSIYVLVDNNLNKEFKGARVSIFIYDFGVALYSNSFNLEKNSNELARIYWEPENIPAGEYMARVEVSSNANNFKDWEHVYLNVR